MTVHDLKELQTFHTSCLSKVLHTDSIHSILPPKRDMQWLQVMVKWSTPCLSRHWKHLPKPQRNKTLLEMILLKLINWRRFGYLVLISIEFDDFTAHFTPKFCFDWEDISNTWDSVSPTNPNTSNVVKNAPLRVITFNSLPGVWIFWWNTVSCVWYITYNTGYPVMFSYM